jgi:hypothetical protein
MDTKTSNRAMKPAEAYEKVSAATTGATDLIKESYSTTLKGAQDYNNKLLEFAQSNSDTAFEFAQRLLRAESSSELVELSDAARRQAATLTEQAKELAALVQKVTLASTETLKAGATKAFRQAS